MKTLFVKHVSEKELLDNWNFTSNSLPPPYQNKVLFIECNQVGNVNWEKAHVYNREALEKRKHEIVYNIKPYKGGEDLTTVSKADLIRAIWNSKELASSQKYAIENFLTNGIKDDFNLQFLKELN